MKEIKKTVLLLGVLLVALLLDIPYTFHTKDSTATLILPYSVDYTNDYIGANSTSNGAIKKTEGNVLYLAPIVDVTRNNHAGGTAPSSPEVGWTWYDSVNSILKVYNGAIWSTVSSATGNDVVDDTTPQLGGNLDLNEFSVQLNPAPVADTAYNGLIETNTAGTAVVEGDLCYLKSDGKYWKIDADVEATTKGMARLATASISANATGTFLVKGYLRKDNITFGAVGANLYASPTPGPPTSTAPSTTGQMVRVVGQVKTANIIWFDPSNDYVQIR